jgi:hypothetical protein
MNPTTSCENKPAVSTDMDVWNDEVAKTSLTAGFIVDGRIPKALRIG